MTEMTPIISLELNDGGFFSGTPQQCIAFLRDHTYLVKHQYIIDRYFHWSESERKYVYIPDMHPTYIRNVLLKELRTMRDIRGLHFMDTILADPDLEPELVADMYRTWCEMFDIEWSEHRDSLISALESTDTLEEPASEAIPPVKNQYGCPDGAVLL